MSDIAVTIRVLKTVASLIREHGDELEADHILALIAAYEEERARASRRADLLSEVKARAERAEQVAEGTRQMFEASQREHEVRLSEARKHIEALLLCADTSELAWGREHTEMCDAARAFLASTEPQTPIVNKINTDTP